MKTTATTRDSRSSRRDAFRVWVGRSCKEEDASGGRHRQTGTWWGSAHNHCCRIWEPCPERTSKCRTWLPIPFQKRGAAVLLSCSLERHPKLGPGAVPPLSSLCKPKGEVRKNQYRRVGELKDQGRKTEVSLATRGSKGTKRSWQTQDESNLRCLKSLVKIYYDRVKCRETAQGQLRAHSTAFNLPSIYINKLKIKPTSKKSIWRYMTKKVLFVVYCCS